LARDRRYDLGDLDFMRATVIGAYNQAQRYLP